MKKTCSKCNNLLDINLFSKDKYQKSGYRCACKSCSNIEYKKFQSGDGYLKRLQKAKNDRALIKTNDPIKIWAHDVFHNAKQRSKKYGIEFNITKDWIIKNSPEYCPLLGFKLIYSASRSEPNSASIDRKDSSKGYTVDNCKIISFKANRIKSNASLDEIKLLAKCMENY